MLFGQKHTIDQGLAVLILLLCMAAGWFADKYRRDLIMRVSGVLMLGASPPVCFYCLLSASCSQAEAATCMMATQLP